MTWLGLPCSLPGKVRARLALSSGLVRDPFQNAGGFATGTAIKVPLILTGSSSAYRSNIVRIPSNSSPCTPAVTTKVFPGADPRTSKTGRNTSGTSGPSARTSEYFAPVEYREGSKEVAWIGGWTVDGVRDSIPILLNMRGNRRPQVELRQ